MRTPVLLYALALGVRLALIALFPDPAYPDSYYYVDVARAIASSGRFEVDFVWIFAEVGGSIPAVPALPIPSNAHWMPLASIVQVPFIWVLGPTAVASALPFAVAGAAAAPITWAIARDAGARSHVAIGAGLLVAIPVLATPFMVQPDNFSLYQPLVAAALWLAARGLRGDGRSFAIAGLLVGLATLSRNDGILVLGALGLAFAWDRWRAWRSNGARRPAIPLGAAIACVGLFALAVAPWYVRQVAVFGQLSPSTASGKVLFIRSIDEWNSITTPATLSHLLGQGVGPLIMSRIGGLIAAITIFTTLVAGGLLLPFMVIGGWLRRRSIDFGPFFVYAGLLFAFSALISAVHVPGGTFIHSAVGLAPHGYILAIEGIVAGVAWIAARRPAWNRDVAARVFITTAVGFAVLAAVGGSLSVHARWRTEREQRLAVARALDAAGAPKTDRLMSIDASGYRYYTGRGGVVLVNDPLEAIERVGRAYRARWLVLERDESVAAVSGILLQDARPPWVGPATWREDDRIALYPLCFDPADPRCAA
ncbi:MAG TPA: glycosyltransferase family 39 protein [Candidatus Limnocylindrales bacterium]